MLPSSRFRQLALLSSLDNTRMAARFPLTAIHMLRVCAARSAATPFPRRLGLFLTNRCDFACPMCAVQDARDEGLACGGDLPFALVEKVLAECSPYQPVVVFITAITRVNHAHLDRIQSVVAARGVPYWGISN